MVRKATNLSAQNKKLKAQEKKRIQESEKRAKKIEEEMIVDYYHKFTPAQLYRYLSPICNIDSLRILQTIIRNAQKSDNIMTMKMIRRKLGYRPRRSVFDSLINSGLLIEPFPYVFSCTVKINEYSLILSMMKLDDSAPDIVDIDELNQYKVLADTNITYNVVSKRGAVIEKFIDPREASKYLDRLYFPKDENDEVVALSKEEEQELMI